MASQFSLLGERRYGPFFVAQSLGALNDNLLKNALVIIATFHAVEFTTLDPKILTQLAGALYILPFLLFSSLSGQIADKHDKGMLMRLVKLAELLVMVLAGLGFFLQNLPLLLGALFLMGTHATFFSPAKYGYLPNVLQERELIGGNALLEAGTFLAILGGTVLAGFLAAQHAPNALIACLLAIAIVGIVASRNIPAIAPSDPDLRVQWRPVSTTWSLFRYARRNATVFHSLVGISWLWALGLVVLSSLPAYTREVIGGTETVVTLLIAVFAIGVGIGSLLCEKLSGHTIEIGLVPLGSAGISLALVWMWFASPATPAVDIGWQAVLVAHWPVVAALGLVGIFGGLYVVPLYALAQSRAERSHISRVQAASNALNGLAMVLGAAYAAALFAAGLHVTDLMLVGALVNVAIALYIYTLLPEFLVRLVAMIRQIGSNRR